MIKQQSRIYMNLRGSFIAEAVFSAKGDHFVASACFSWNHLEGWLDD
jgi:hypothetical protein